MLIQFSPVRSGSTLIYNYLKGVGKQPHKCHNYQPKANAKYIITIRHPFNSIISLSLIRKQDINTRSISANIEEYLSQGGYDISKREFNNQDHCLFLYEDFYNNHDMILDKLEAFFRESYSSEHKDKLKERLKIESVKRYIQKNGFKDFSQYDKNTHIHGNHINKYNGRTDYNVLLGNQELEILNNNHHLQQIISKYY